MFFRNKTGFSYIELLTVIFIIMLLSTIAIVNVNNNKGGPGKLFVSVQKIVSDVRLSQSYALSDKELNGDIPDGGWGVYFDVGRDYYSIFADKSTINNIVNYVCFSDCLPTSEENYNDINFPDDTGIDRIFLVKSDGTEVFVNKINIVFEPPDPAIHFCVDEGDCDYDSVHVDFVNSKGDKRELVINFFGLVDTHETFY